MISIKSSKLLFIPLIFLFLPAFCIPLGLLVPSYYLFIVIIFLPFMVLNYKKVGMLTIELYHHTPFKYFIFFTIWIILSLLILVLLQKVSLLSALSAIIIILGGYFLLYFLYPAYIFNKYLTIKKITKILCIGFYILFIWGIVTYLGQVFNIKILQILENFFSNRQFIVNGHIFTLARARSFIYEPGRFAYFIALNLPLFFYISKCKYKIFNNDLINLFIKKSLLPLALLNLIFTFSPIGWFFAGVIAIYCNFRNILKILVNKQLLIKIILIISVLSLLTFPQYKKIIECSAVKRILVVVTNSIKDIENLTFIEPSLYTRIVSYVNSYNLFLEHPILGVGLDQSKFKIMSQFEKSPILLSKENNLFLEKAYQTGKMSYNRSILCDLLCETGIIGCMLFYIFLFKSVLLLNKLSKFHFGFKNHFIKTIRDILLMIICLSFYEVSIVHIPYHFFIFALSNILILKTRYLRSF